MVFNHDGALLGAASLPSPSEGSVMAEAAGGAGAGGGAGEGEGAEVVVEGGEDGAAGLVVMPTKEEMKEAQVCFCVVVEVGRVWIGCDLRFG